MGESNDRRGAPASPVTVITGAGSGIGRAAAELLASKGHRLVLVGRTESKLHDTLDVVKDLDADAMIVVADLADSDQAGRVVDQTIERFDRLDNLVNAAGVAPLAPIERTTHAVLEEAFHVNAFGPAALIVKAWPIFRRQKSGCVVNVSTIGTSDPFPGFFAYAASKSALDSFTRSCAREGRSIGVRAFCVNPGAVETPLLRKNFPENLLPREKALRPEAVAKVIAECIEGAREKEHGVPIALPSPR
ncbi:MAG: SDR family oxidoreductase [Phycisphaeraceae bacterium]|nr:SDR family oxidoreductase [Phycisphaeraceae bacterium]